MGTVLGTLLPLFYGLGLLTGVLLKRDLILELVYNTYYQNTNFILKADTIKEFQNSTDTKL